MVRKPGKHQRSKQRGQDLGWKVHDRAHCLFCAHTLCMGYVIARLHNNFPLLTMLVRNSKQGPKIMANGLYSRLRGSRSSPIRVCFVVFSGKALYSPSTFLQLVV